MCKGCDMTREIEKLYREHGILTGERAGGLSAELEDFEAAINAPLNIISHIAATWFGNRNDRQAFLRDVSKRLEHMTKQRVGGNSALH